MSEIFKELKELYEKMARVINSDIDEETKKDIIFSNKFKERVDELLSKYDYQISYFSYNTPEDYVNLFKEKMKMLNSSFEDKYNEETMKDIVYIEFKMDKIMKMKISHEEKYDMIFSDMISQKLYQLFNENNIHFDPYIPDTSYEEDYTYFYNEAKQKINEIKFSQ